MMKATLVLSALALLAAPAALVDANRSPAFAKRTKYSLRVHPQRHLLCLRHRQGPAHVRENVVALPFKCRQAARRQAGRQRPLPPQPRAPPWLLSCQRFWERPSSLPRPGGQLVIDLIARGLSSGEWPDGAFSVHIVGSALISLPRCPPADMGAYRPGSPFGGKASSRGEAAVGSHRPCATAWADFLWRAASCGRCYS